MGKLVRAITKDGFIKAVAIDSTDIVDKAAKFHVTSAVVTAALGRLLTAASMMGDMLKGEKDTLTLRIAGDGPIEALIAVADQKGNVKGYPVNPVVEIPLKNNGKLDVGGAVGKGNLYVLKDLGLKEPYNGVIPLVSGEIAEDITAYYAVSEQIPTICALGVLVNPDLTVKKAGGYIIQLLPGVADDVVERLEKSIKGVKPVTTLMDEGMSIEDILKDALNEFDVDFLCEQEVNYVCPCSRQRTEKVILTLGKDDILKLADEMPVVTVKCHFCDKKYHFSPMQLRKLVKDKN